MPLDTQQFGISRYWLSTALKNIPSTPDVFVASKQLSQARKLFLAGKNQLSAIRNWLVGAGVIDAGRGEVKLSELGLLMAAQDSRAEMALTWWLFHLHLCVNPDSFPYSQFFLLYDAEGRWIRRCGNRNTRHRLLGTRSIGMRTLTLSESHSRLPEKSAGRR